MGQPIKGAGMLPGSVEGVTAMEVQFRRYDTANYLKTEDDITAYFEAVMEDGDPALIAAALGDVVRARATAYD